MKKENRRIIGLQYAVLIASTWVSCYVHVYGSQNVSVYYVKTYEADTKSLDSDSTLRE